jgi:hypothetical protein
VILDSRGRQAVATGRRRPQPWSLPVKLHANAFTGFLLLRILAGNKRLRRNGARYREEQAMIKDWLGAVERAAREAALADEVGKALHRALVARGAPAGRAAHPIRFVPRKSA